eukprot:TRINITY_DN3950_c0_g2_i1.p3 TRINITY_DN3950_c0_g2~~TRINITY_DN3950_c0_g2_i1.p3  ORF type:complete len:137 (-),score=3.18 TRINITY_DN3950_c0_g2_i1:511-921(-)
MGTATRIEVVGAKCAFVRACVCVRPPFFFFFLCSAFFFVFSFVWIGGRYALSKLFFPSLFFVFVLFLSLSFFFLGVASEGPTKKKEQTNLLSFFFVGFFFPPRLNSFFSLFCFFFVFTTPQHLVGCCQAPLAKTRR